MLLKKKRIIIKETDLTLVSDEALEDYLDSTRENEPPEEWREDE